MIFKISATNLLLFLFDPFVETKKRITFSSSYLFGNEKHIYIIWFIASCALFQRNAKFNRLFKSHHPAKFGDHRHSESGDLMLLLCHMISKDKAIKESYNFKGRSLLW